MNPAFGQSKQDILNFLSTQTRLVPKKEIISRFIRPLVYEPRIESALNKCLTEQLIKCNVKEEFFITDAGKQILSALEDRKRPKKKAHQYRNGLRCINCGLNRKSIYGSGFWYDGEKVAYIIPACK